VVKLLWKIACVCFACMAMAEVAFAAETAFIQATLGPEGSGSMLANVANGHPGEAWSWNVCAPDGSECASFGGGQAITTGATPGGHVFVATEAVSGASVTSPVWNGPTAAATPPSISGAVRANALVTPVVGTWTGGWIGDFDVTQLAACESPAGTGCTSLTDPDYPGGCPGAAAVIDAAFTGMYLRVADRVYGPNTTFSAEADSTPYEATVWPAGPTVSVAMAGQILAATGARESACGPPPIEERQQQPSQLAPSQPPSTAPTAPVAAPKRRRAGVTVTRTGLVFVICPSACRIVTTIRRGPKRRLISAALKKRGTWKLRLSARSIARLGPGRAQLIVRVNGLLIARRSVRLVD
jgi:hypothetical protein